MKYKKKNKSFKKFTKIMIQLEMRMITKYLKKYLIYIYIYIHISKRKTLLIILVFIQYYNNRISKNSKLVREYNKPTN